MIALQGRILPKTEPYCRASFLIEIKLPIDYPFKPPEVMFLDPIYHPNVDKRGCQSCCTEHLLRDKWNPTKSLEAFVEATIYNIDNIPPLNQSVHADRAKEYEYHREKFYENALRCTLSYGRPRD